MNCKINGEDHEDEAANRDRIGIENRGRRIMITKANDEREQRASAGVIAGTCCTSRPHPHYPYPTPTLRTSTRHRPHHPLAAVSVITRQHDDTAHAVSGHTPTARQLRPPQQQTGDHTTA